MATFDIFSCDQELDKTRNLDENTNTRHELGEGSTLVYTCDALETLRQVSVSKTIGTYYRELMWALRLRKIRGAHYRGIETPG